MKNKTYAHMKSIKSRIKSCKFRKKNTLHEQSQAIWYGPALELKLITCLAGTNHGSTTPGDGILACCVGCVLKQSAWMITKDHSNGVMRGLFTRGTCTIIIHRLALR